MNRDALINALLTFAGPQTLYEDLPEEVRRACKQAADMLCDGPNNDEYTNWLEDELMECMRLVSNGLYGHGQDEDEITDALRLHGIRLLVEADAEKYEAALDRWQKRHPERDATQRSMSRPDLDHTDGGQAEWPEPRND